MFFSQWGPGHGYRGLRVRHANTVAFQGRLWRPLSLSWWHRGTGGHLTGSTSPATPIRVWSTVQHRNCSPLDFILRTMEKGRLISLPPAGGHRALVWQLAGEEESSCSSQVPPLMPQQTRPSPTGHRSAECMVGFCQSSLCFHVFLPLPVPRPCGRIINSHGREGE